MSAATVLGILLDLVFLALGVQSLVDMIRRYNAMRRDVALLFALLAIPFLIQFLTVITGEKASEVASFLSSLALILEPYLLLRLVRYVRSQPAKVLWMALAAMLASVLVRLVFGSHLPLPLSLVIIAYLIGFNVYAMVGFVHGALNSTGVVQQRLRLAAVGSSLFALLFVEILLAIPFPQQKEVILLAADTIAMGCALAFYLGFAPPRWLQRIWQLAEADRYLSQLSRKTLDIDVSIAQITTELCRVASRGVGGITAGIVQKERASQRWRVVYADPHHPLPWDEAAAEALDCDHAVLRYLRASQLSNAGEQQVLEAVGAKSLLMAPILMTKGIWGLLLVFLQHGSLFIEDDLHFVHRLAEQSAILLENSMILLENRDLVKHLSRYAENLEERTVHLTAANKELDAFSYSVSHDLRAPLRAVDGFSQVLLEDYQEVLDENGRDYLHRLRTESQRMGQLIDDLIGLSRLSRTQMTHQEVDLSAMVHRIAADLQSTDPQRVVEFVIQPGIKAYGDEHLLQVALQNLLGNAWKYTAKQPQPCIEFGCTQGTQPKEYYIRDNGAGFDMAYVGKLFGAFQRLHAMEEFAGTGIGLATVQRIMHRHGGLVRAEGVVNGGATFYFHLGTRQDVQKGENYETYLVGRGQSQ